MSTTNLTLVAVPNQTSVRGMKITDLIKTALTFESMLATGTQKSNNLRQYILQCQRMEEMAINVLAEDKNEANCVVSSVYLRHFTNMKSNDANVARILKAFCPNDQTKSVAVFLKGLAKTAQGQLKQDLESAAEIYGIAFVKKRAVVVIQNHEVASEGPAKLILRSQPVDIDKEFLELQVPDVVTDNKGKSNYIIFYEHVTQQVRLASRGSKNGLNVALASNVVITKVLREFVYAKKGGNYRPVSLKVLYNDGSEAKPFTVYGLQGPRGENINDNNAEVHNEGMISSRHPEIDPFVEHYWFPNAMVSQTRTSAETDEVSYQYSLKLFGDLKRIGGRHIIYFYQTGFQYSLIGFFRAVVDTLKASESGEPWLKVVPMLFSGNAGYTQGDPWC